MRRPADGPPHLALLDTHGATRDVMALTPSLQIVGLDLAPDGRELILAHMLASESDLRLASPREAVAATP